jgi:hypothetical protein
MGWWRMARSVWSSGTFGFAATLVALACGCRGKPAPMGAPSMAAIGGADSVIIGAAGSVGGAAGSVAGGGGAGTGESAAVTDAGASAAVAPWAIWPMPNATAGLPNAQSYDTHDPNVVTDRVTGLMWQRKLDGKLLPFADAKQQCESSSLGGFSDWRVPSRIELVSILNVTRVEPSINVTAFPQTPNDWFWTSSIAADNPLAAWFVYFYFGYPKTDLMSNQFSVRCVRSAILHTPPASHYDIQPNTVRDLGTGLTWQRAVSDQMFSFDAARAHCTDLTIDGKKGFRAPSLNEMLTLIDERAPVAPLIDAAAFPNTPSEPFWTGSYFGGVPGMSWQVYFDHGNALYGLPNATFHIRCVL